MLVNFSYGPKKLLLIVRLRVSAEEQEGEKQKPHTHTKNNLKNNNINNNFFKRQGLIRRNQLCLCLIQALVSDGHDLMEDVADVLLPAVAVSPFVSVGRRQGHAPLHRVPGQVHAGQSLQHPGLIVHGSGPGRAPGGHGSACPAQSQCRAPGRALHTHHEKRKKKKKAKQNNNKKNVVFVF